MVLGGFTGSEVATKTVDVSYLYADMGFGFMPSTISDLALVQG